MSWHKADPISFDSVATFLRQLTHDIRNGLNAVDLQSAYMAELLPEGEVSDEMKRLRQMLRDITKSLQSLSRKLQEPQTMVIDCPASMMFESLQTRASEQFVEDAAKITWSGNVGEESVELDVERFCEAFMELLRNAFQFSERTADIRVNASTGKGVMNIEISERKAAPESSPEEWGLAPFVSTRRGGYGLGLFRVRAVCGAQNIGFRQRYDADAGELVSSLAVPFKANGS